MLSMSPPLLAPLPAEAEAVLMALTVDRPPNGLKLNDISARTGLPTGHVGRHLRTLERDRLARYEGGAWHPTLRGLRHPVEPPTHPVAA
jgi:DNA-binding IclR family transcriptional regulator